MWWVSWLRLLLCLGLKLEENSNPHTSTNTTPTLHAPLPSFSGQQQWLGAVMPMGHTQSAANADGCTARIKRGTSCSGSDEAKCHCVHHGERSQSVSINRAPLRGETITEPQSKTAAVAWNHSNSCSFMGALNSGFGISLINMVASWRRREFTHSSNINKMRTVRRVLMAVIHNTLLFTQRLEGLLPSWFLYAHIW